MKKNSSRGKKKLDALAIETEIESSKQYKKWKVKKVEKINDFFTVWNSASV
jgi:hypothetical protein